ncbi:bifunctional Cation-H+ exchanger/Cation-H+ exchanger [Babesia duncani]|uniref:Bifunctional Cation-H+ exchanger/Cation-H+ exchanger n=1 Tax=Babesia duncani TaxID=323732 RepID=A0AAD9PJE2_9APIC|nr:bifunctional Cation-H+ exchanger/Cation-H+ exchanger [Babesia duncani]
MKSLCLYTILLFLIRDTNCTDETVSQPLKLVTGSVPSDNLPNTQKDLIKKEEDPPLDDKKDDSNEDINIAGISDTVTQLVSLCCFMFLGSCIMQFIISKLNDKIPISIVCFVFGMVCYEIFVQLKRYKLLDPLTLAISGLRNIDSSILYYIALPILLYEATQSINWYTFCNFLWGGIGLAVVGVVFQVFLLGVLFHYVIDLSLGSVVTSFLLASILSSTDPVAVLAILNGVNARFKLSSIFNGESLINDGSSVLLFQFFYLLRVGSSQSIGYYTLLFFKFLILGPLLGICFAIVVILWISLYRKHHISQCLAVMTSGYLVYFVAEYCFNLSGPLAIVFYGIFIKGYGMFAFDRDAIEKHDHFMEGLCLISNSSVFIISGALTAGMLRTRFESSELGLYIGKLLLCYLALIFARALMIAAFSPLLYYIGYGIDLKEGILLIWGGLRGAMVLVLGLRLECTSSIEDDVSDFLGFYISGSVMIILLVQGFTFELLYKWLNPYPMKVFRQSYLAKVMRIIDYNYTREAKLLNTHWLFKGTNVVQYANRLVPLMTSVKWNKMGKLVFNIPNIREALSGVSAETLYNGPYEPNNDDLFIPHRVSSHNVTMPRVITFTSTISAASDSEFEDGALPPKEPDLGILDKQVSASNTPLGSSRNSMPMSNVYEPLEHALTIDATNELLTNDLNKTNLPVSKASPRFIRSSRKSTIDAIFTKPVHLQAKIPISVRSIESIDSVYRIDQLDDAAMADRKRTIRKEREIELFSMIFNAFSHLYNKLYRSALIDGGSLLVLQSSLDIASDFLLKGSHKRFISSWESVLVGYKIGDEEEAHSNLQSMDGFEFEWFVLKAIIEGNKATLDSSVGGYFVHFNQHSKVLSLLEMITAFIEVHVQMLELGGRKLPKLLGDKLMTIFP